MMVKFLATICNSFLLLCVTGITACQKSQPVYNGRSDTLVVNNNTGKTYLALGDSYTIGQSVQSNERFPYLTVAGLRKDGINISDPVYIAQTGWRTDNLLNAITAQNPPATFDVVTLLIGVNDQYQRRDTGDYRQKFTALLDKAILLAGSRRNRVFVLSIPDYSATPFVAAQDKDRVSREIGLFNAINKEVTLQDNIAYVNITPLTLEAATDQSLLANDLLHYSAKEHQKWADLLVPLIRQQLK